MRLSLSSRDLVIQALREKAESDGRRQVLAAENPGLAAGFAGQAARAKVLQARFESAQSVELVDEDEEDEDEEDEDEEDEDEDEGDSLRLPGAAERGFVPGAVVR